MFLTELDFKCFIDCKKSSYRKIFLIFLHQSLHEPLFSSLQVLNVFVIFGSILIGGLVYHELQTENNNLKIRVSSLESSLTEKASTISLTSIIDSLNTLNTKHSNTCAAVRYWVESSANIKIIKFLLKFC